MRLIYCVIVVILGCITAGCSQFGRLDYTRPSTVQPNDDYIPIYRDEYPELSFIPLERSDLEMAVAASADQTVFLVSPLPIPIPLLPWLPGIVKSDWEVSQLSIQFWLISKQRNISFDPRGISILTSEGKRLSAARQEGPILLEKGNRPDIPYVCRLSSTFFGAVRQQEFVITEPVCMSLGFRINAVPVGGYRLLIEGIRKDGESVVLPPVEFKQSSRMHVWNGQLQ